MSLTKMYVIVIAICCILFAGCCGSGDSSATPEDVTPVSTPSSRPTGNATESAGPVTAGPDETLTIRNGQVNTQISVDEVIRGSRANTIIAESNMSNYEPVPGYEYLMVNIHMKNTDDYSLAVSPFFDLPVYVSGASYNQEFVVLEGYQVLEPTTLLPDGQINGWIVYMVPVGESARLAYEPLLPDEPLGFIRLS